MTHISEMRQDLPLLRELFKTTYDGDVDDDDEDDEDDEVDEDDDGELKFNAKLLLEQTLFEPGVVELAAVVVDAGENDTQYDAVLVIGVTIMPLEQDCKSFPLLLTFMLALLILVVVLSRVDVNDVDANISNLIISLFLLFLCCC